MAIDRTIVRGLREARNTFRQLPDIAREAFNEAVQKTAEHVVDAARPNVPLGRTGALRKAIGYTLSKRNGSANIGIRKGFTVAQPGRNGSALTKHGAFLHKPTAIGHLVEFGHKGPHPAGPHPFLVPAAKGSTDFFLSQCREAGKVLERDMATVGSRNL
jgi:HK97 gp10 family phage protein